MSTTYTTLRANLMKLLQNSRAGTCTTIGAEAGATLISTELQKWDGGSDDHYNERWIRILTSPGTTTNEGNERFIYDYAAATGTITPRPAFTAQMSATGTFEIFPWEPAIILDACQRVIRQLYPNPQAGRKGIFRTLYDEQVANGWLWNGHFEDFTLTTIPDHWVKVGTATVSEETTIIAGPLGSSAVKMTGGGATDYIYQSHVENPALLELGGKTVTFYVKAYAAAATTARLTVAYKIASDSSLTTTSSSYHTGNSEYELLSKEVALPLNLTDLQVRLESTGGTVYFDNGYGANGPLQYRYHMSKDYLHDPIVIEYQLNDGSTYGADMVGGEAWQTLPHGMWHVEADGSTRMLVIHRVNENTTMPYTYSQRRKIRITGNELLSVPTIDSSTVEVDNEQADTIVCLMAAELTLLIEASLSIPKVDWRMKAEQMLMTYGKPFPMNHVRISF